MTPLSSGHRHSKLLGLVALLLAGCSTAPVESVETCTIDCAPTSCGDGIVQSGEACDDGNDLDTDACTPSCTSTFCGDGIVQSGEACDDGNTVDTDDCMNSCQPPAALTKSVGPILLQPAPRRPVVSIYLVSPGGAYQAELAVDRIGSAGGVGPKDVGDPYPTQANIALVRVFEPDEVLRHWHYQRQEPGMAKPLLIASATEPPPASFQFDDNGNSRGYRFSLSQPGIYEVRVATNSYKTVVSVRLPEPVGYGVSLQNGAFGWPYCLGSCLPVEKTSLYAFIPRHPMARMFLDLVQNPQSPQPDPLPPPTVRELGAPSALVPVMVGTAQRYGLAPGTADAGEVWELEFPAATKVMHFDAAGIPLILCDSVASATAIHASTVQVLSGPHKGTLVSHRFQREILELLPELLSAANVGTDALSDTLGGSAYTSVPSLTACAGTGSATGMGALSADEAWRHSDLLQSYDSPLKTVRWYLSRASVDLNGAVSYGAGTPMLELSPTSHFAGAVGLPLLERQRCRESMEGVAGGACSDDGTCVEAFDPLKNRWDVLRGVRYKVRDNALYYDAFTGLALPSGAPRQLMLAATLSHPCNPWGPPSANAAITHPELIARAAAIGLADLLVVGEDERQLSVGDTDPYPGSAGFQLSQFTQNFAAVGGKLPLLLPGDGKNGDLGQRVQRVWAEGLRRVVDRHQPVYMTTTMNQSSTFLLGTEEFAHGADGLPFAALYRQVARENGVRFVAEASPGGWLPEASGPSFSYAGMQHWHMGQYLHRSAKDPEGEDKGVREALAASYRFFSYFTAEEPDGQRTSGFNFSHRIGIGFELEQWGGARGVAESIPEVALWSAWQFPQSGPTLTQAYQSVKSLANGFGGPIDGLPRQSLNGEAEVALSLDSKLRPTLPLLPANASGDLDLVVPAAATGKPPELLTVRRSAYYAALYIGHTAPRSSYSGHFGTTKAIPLLKGSVNIEDYNPSGETGYLGGGTTPHAIDYYEQSPMIGGGLSLLTTPSYGSAVLATNWSPLTHHGLVAKTASLVTPGTHRRFWEDYEQVTTDRLHVSPGGDCARLFPADEHLTLPTGFTVYGRLEGEPQDATETKALVYQGLCYARHYTFADDHIGVRIVLKRIAPSTGGALERLFENIPVPTCTRAICNMVTGDGGLLNRKSKGATVTEDLTLGKQLLHVRDGATPTPHGLDIALPVGRTVTVMPHGLRYSYYGSELQVGRVEIDLSVPVAVGDASSLAYVLTPVN